MPSTKLSSCNALIFTSKLLCVTTSWCAISEHFKLQKVRKGQRTNQKYRNLVGSDQQMQKLEESELGKADRTVGVNCNILVLINIVLLVQDF